MENINLNKSECIKTRSDLTGTTYVNVCTGAEKFVRYGSLDIATSVFLFVVLILVGWMLTKVFKYF